MYVKSFFVGVVFLSVCMFPFAAHAAEFATQSLFLSKSSVAEGETVLVHVVVFNNSDTTFNGQLAIFDSTTPIGKAPVSLDAGETSTISISWKPKSGNHPISAKLIAADGTVLAEKPAETTDTFSIAPKQTVDNTVTQPTITPDSTIESSLAIQQTLSNISPAIGKIAQPVLSALDGARGMIAYGLDGGITWSKGQLAPTSTSISIPVTSANKKKGQTNSNLQASAGNAISQNMFLTIFLTAELYLFSVLLYVVANAAIFYPLLAIAFFYCLWKLYRRMRRPQYYPY